MRGKKAKILRKMAFLYIRDVAKEDPGKGFNEYHQVNNRMDWVFAEYDGDGKPMMKPEKVPGTIHCAWNQRVIYQKLKKELRGKPVKSISNTRMA